MKITLMRHGRPLIDLKQRSIPSEIPEFLVQYDAAELDASLPPPRDVVDLASQATVVVCSDLPRSISSAQRLGLANVHLQDSVFREVPIPSFDLSFPELRNDMWIVVLRLLQALGYSRRAESMKDARARARRCAERLESLTVASGHVLLVGHSVLNWLIGKELRAMGWQGPSALAQRYWGFTERHLDSCHRGRVVRGR